MNIDKVHGQRLACALSHCGARIIQHSGVIFDAAYHGHELPMDGYAMKQVEIEARGVLDAIETYRLATGAADADPVVRWPHMSHNRLATGRPNHAIRGEDVLPAARLRGGRIEPLSDDGPGPEAA